MSLASKDSQGKKTGVGRRRGDGGSKKITSNVSIEVQGISETAKGGFAYLFLFLSRAFVID